MTTHLSINTRTITTSHILIEGPCILKSRVPSRPLLSIASFLFCHFGRSPSILLTHSLGRALLFSAVVLLRRRHLRRLSLRLR